MVLMVFVFVFVSVLVLVLSTLLILIKDSVGASDGLSDSVSVSFNVGVRPFLSIDFCTIFLPIFGRYLVRPTIRT